MFIFKFVHSSSNEELMIIKAAVAVTFLIFEFLNDNVKNKRVFRSNKYK